MADEQGKSSSETVDGSCQIRVWCEACKRSDYASQAEKYLCNTCGKIMVLDHEVHHEPFPHLSGDKDNMS